MLALSSTSPTDELSNIVSSTAAVIFLGTPHRGSPDLSALGAWAKSVLSGLRFQTNSAILDTLGLKTTDLERSQEAFSGLWFQHGFRVKTFQEGYPMTKINLGVLGNKVVPDTSSLIGDQRERAETLQANHMKMCRFSGREDPNFVKVVGELRSAYLTILTGMIQNHSTDQPAALTSTISNVTGPAELTSQQAACLKSLQFPYMNRRRQLIEDPAPQTGHWLIENETYSHWLFDDLRERPCILWLKGNPGAGKSTLMKQAFRHAKSSLDSSEYCVAGVFISAKGEPLEHSSNGVFRSLLHQLLPHYPIQFQEAVRTWIELSEWMRHYDEAEVTWRVSELKSLLNSILGYETGKRTVVFIDGLDELGVYGSMLHAEFWEQISKGQNSGRVRLCLSSRHYPHFSFSSASELIAEDLNGRDILTYIDQRLSARIAKSESHWVPELRNTIVHNAEGIFLWVTLTMDSLLAKYDQGKSLRLLLSSIHSMPRGLERLFKEMVASIDPDLRVVAVRAFEWALMSTTPLRLHQWHHVLAFIKTPVPKSLKEWRESVNYTESDSQLEREIKALSGGLLQVSTARPDEEQLEDEDYLSIRAGAGSLDLEQGETRIVQVVHQCVRDFFLDGDGFWLLGRSTATDPDISCHISIAITCLDYICISELDDLVDARRASREREAALSFEQVLSEAARSESSPAPEERNLAQDSTQDRQEGFAEHLRLLPMDDLLANIANWTGARNVPTNSASSAASTRYADSILSAANISFQLEDWPSLLFYITSNLLTHVRAVKESDVHSSDLDGRLDDKDLWARFVLLSEDTTLDLSVPGFMRKSGFTSPASSPGIIPFSPHESRSPSRAGSVASFSSASSYA